MDVGINSYENKENFSDAARRWSFSSTISMKLGITFYVKEVYLNNITIRIPESSRLRDRERKENTNKDSGKGTGK